MQNERPNPDELLASLKQEEEAEKKGKLKIFFGMSPGVGKTYTMLQTAKADAAKGVGVVVGYVESHNRAETNALLEGLEIIPRKKVEYKGTSLEEMDVDAIIRRHPYLVLVDELAHTNAPGCRHLKRYQDVLDILDAGINVYTTVNVQHIATKADTVTQITGITIRETLPDEVFERADEVELVDITPDELLDRLAEGKVYTPDQSKEAVKNFFRKGNITALREMSLRMVAERVDKQLKTYMKQKRIQGPWKTGYHFMVLVGPSPSSAKLIRWAKSLAHTIGARLTVLHVESVQPLEEKAKEQLSHNINLAKQLEAEVIVTSGNDVVDAAIDIARRENITHIIIGKSGEPKTFFSLFSKNNFVNRLLEKSGNIDIYVLGSEATTTYHPKRKKSFLAFSSGISEYFLAIISVVIASLLCIPIGENIGYQSISFILLFVVSILATFLRVGPILAAASTGALLWNFFFIPPQLTFHVEYTSDILTLFMFFTIALVNGILTSKVKKQERLAIDREERTNALFQLTKGLAESENIQQAIDVGMSNIKKYFSIDPYFVLQDGNGQLSTHKYIPEGEQIPDTEYSVANWVFNHSRKAGKFTDTLPASEYTYYPLKGTRYKTGVIAIRQKKPFVGDKEIFWDTFLTQISSTIERLHLSKLARKASFLDESDRLYKTLFNSISHELRIPVATVMAASETLLESQYPEEMKKELYGEIYTASKRLNRLIENLLNMSRLESGRIALRLDWNDIHDLFNSVVDNLKDELITFKMDIIIPDSMPLAQFDFGLLEQTLYNLVYNSTQYATPDSTIRLKAFYDNGYLVIQEMDRGPGFKPDILAFVFDKFYRVEGSKSGGLGLGLSIAKGFIEAHKGTITAENRENGGARFTIKIPTEIMYMKSEEN